VSNAPVREAEPVIVFETLTGATLDPRHNEIRLYTWGNENCCLPREAASAVLVGRYEGLRAGDHLLFEDDQGHRDVVRLIADAEILALPAGSPPPESDDRLTLVRWSDVTPLHHDYCLGEAPTSPPTPRTRARGNLVVATHGETTSEPLRAPGQSTVPGSGPTLRRNRLRLDNGPLAYLDARTLRLAALPTGPEPRTAFTARPSRSTSTLRVEVDGQRWQERKTLLGSRPDDQVFRVELDDDGTATVVFGDDVVGQRLPDTATVTATYRVGGGAVGNVAADTLTRPLPPDARLPWLISVTNPLPAVGGRDPESRDHARQVGPATFQRPLVAVTSHDYQAAAQAFTDAQGRSPVQRATAAFRWTGSWLTVRLAVDPLGSESLSSELSQSLRDHLETVRLTGYDLAVARAVYVPVDLAVEFCVAPGARASDVQHTLRQALSTHDRVAAGKGFFHPDNFSFGDHLYVSRLFAAIMAVPGVESAQITRLARLHAAEPERDTATNLRQGFLSIGPDEIIRLDNDRNVPEQGVLVIRPRGGAR
jgi:hypothetical protein